MVVPTSFLTVPLKVSNCQKWTYLCPFFIVRKLLKFVAACKTQLSFCLEICYVLLTLFIMCRLLMPLLKSEHFSLPFFLFRYYTLFGPFIITKEIFLKHNLLKLFLFQLNLLPWLRIRLVRSVKEFLRIILFAFLFTLFSYRTSKCAYLCVINGSQKGSKKPQQCLWQF